MSADDMNESELSVSEDGVLEEEFPDEIVTEKEASILARFCQWAFILLGILIWSVLGISVGRIAYLFQPSDLMKLLAYFLIYFLFLRIPFGTTNKIIMKTYEHDTMPDKIVFAIVMILGFIIGINFYESVPDLMKWHLQLL